MTRHNPVSVDWGGDPDGFSTVHPFLEAWVKPVLTSHLAFLGAAAIAATALSLPGLGPAGRRPSRPTPAE